jgi:hypothetical protein
MANTAPFDAVSASSSSNVKQKKRTGKLRSGGAKQSDKTGRIDYASTARTTHGRDRIFASPPTSDKIGRENSYQTPLTLMLIVLSQTRSSVVSALSSFGLGHMRYRQK